MIFCSAVVLDFIQIDQGPKLSFVLVGKAPSYPDKAQDSQTIFFRNSTKTSVILIFENEKYEQLYQKH